MTLILTVAVPSFRRGHFLRANNDQVRDVIDEHGQQDVGHVFQHTFFRIDGVSSGGSVVLLVQVRCFARIPRHHHDGQQSSVGKTRGNVVLDVLGELSAGSDEEVPSRRRDCVVRRELG